MRLIKNSARLVGTGAYGIFAWLTFTVITVPTLALLVVVPGVDNRRRLVRRAARLVFQSIGARPRELGLENLPDRPCILVANHSSYLDGIILTAVLPARFAFVIKREMTQVPLAHFLLRRIGSEFVDRFDARRGATDARRLLQRANGQVSLAFFPEGTFTRLPGLGRFHNGAFVAAARANLPVVPTVIRGSRDMLPLAAWLPRPAPLITEVLPPVEPMDEDGRTARALMAASRQALLEALGEPDLVTERNRGPGT